MTSIERTAYPRFKRLITASELHNHFTPTHDEAAWASERTDSDAHLLAVVLALKCLAKMGRFPGLEEIPAVVVDFVRRDLRLPEDTVPAWSSARVARHHKAGIRERLGWTNDQSTAREVAEAAIRAEAALKNHPPDLINVALDKLTEASLEFPAYSTLDALASRVRTEVNLEIFEMVAGRLSEEDWTRLLALIEIVGLSRKSLFDQLKRPPKAPTWSHLKDMIKHLAWVDSLGDTAAWLDGVAAGKIADFAGEADAADAAVLKDYHRTKRVVLIACLLHRSCQDARDDLANMMCKRVAIKVKAAKTELAEIQSRQRELSESLVGKFKTLLRHLDADGPLDKKAKAAAALAEAGSAALKVTENPAAVPDADAAARFAFGKRLGARSAPHVAALVAATRLHAAGVGAVSNAVANLGGFTQLYSDIDTVSAHYGDLYELLVPGHLFRSDRASLYEVCDTLDLSATSSDARVLAALEHARRHRTRTAEFITGLGEDGQPVDLGFATEKWQRVMGDPDRPGQLSRKHFEAAVFVHLAAELRSGDVAVAGAGEYADWNAALLTWEECRDRLPAYLVEVGLAENEAEAACYGPEQCADALRDQLKKVAADADAEYPENQDLTIDPETGKITLTPLKGRDIPASAKKLATLIRSRMPERTLLSVLGRTAYWLEWWRRFGPASGSDPKIKDPFGRYVITAFVYGTNMGAYDGARHLSGVSSHELLTACHRHASIAKLNEAITDIVNGHARLDLVAAWGDGTVAAADGTHVETWLDNLLAENSIRHGKPGGIAYHHVSDLYIALFTHFIPCGVWEAVYIIEGLLRNASEVRPKTVHADTQGQSYPIYTLAHLMGFVLMPRVRNWQDLTFYRPSETTKYTHIDALFGPPGKNTIDWALITTHYRDLMRVALSIRAGVVASPTLMRRLSSNSRRNHIYQVFREVGKVLRTIALLRFLSDGPLRRRVTAATNKAESYNGFAAWLQFGKRGVLADNDPDEQEELMKFNQHLANAVIFHNTVDMTQAIRELQAEGHTVNPEDLARISPFLHEHLKRFGDYPTDEATTAPEAFDAHLDIDFDVLHDDGTAEA